jgi:branched-chain amino acid transport system ATP-binding protein
MVLKFGPKIDHDQILDIVGLNGKENLFPDQLDLFDKKMTMLAASLATRPKLLLLDEPIAGLSLPQIKKSVALIKKLQRDFNITILIIEHLMDVLTDISDTLMILHDGKVICSGKPEDVVQDEVVFKVYTGIENA